MKGTITFYSDQRGFGFIDPDERIGNSIFFHVSTLKDPQAVVREGTRVSFDPVRNASVKHPIKATNVEVIENTPSLGARS
jgi:cold shock CspA family protein